MNYRYAALIDNESLGAAGTKTIDIDVKDPISRIEIGWHPTLGDLAMLAALPVGITKIELVDGSDVLHSLEGRANQALCLYDRRVPTLNHGELAMNSDLYATMGIDFGRYLWDPELAFDPKQFRNPQLKITHNRALLSASTSTHYLDVFAHLFDEKQISPVGFLMSKEHYNYTPTAENAYETIDLPTDYPIRQLLLRGYQSGQDPHDVVDELKLSEDNDKRIPFDCNLEWYIRRMKGDWEAIQEIWADYGYTDNSVEKYVTSTDHMTVMGGVGDRDLAAPYLNTFIKGGYVQVRAGAACGMQFYHTHGYLPHHCIQFPFGRQDQLDDWYEIGADHSLKARVLSAAQYSGSEISILLQQLRRY